MPTRAEPLIGAALSGDGVAGLEGTWDAQRLADYLKALANPNRLALLHALRSPRPVREIELHPESVHDGENPERRISQQAVRDHLAKLRAIGVITVRRAERDGALVDQFVLDHQRLFAIVEELRQLGELRTDTPLRSEPTLIGIAGAARPAATGPHLVLVRGQNEGRVFPLQAANQSMGRGWVIGRKRGIAVTLDYDPFVSAENAEIMSGPDGHAVLDLRTSRNGTWLNFERIPRGEDRTLAHGDVVSVGRTHLVFRSR